jgi:hypothetical protein
MRYGGQKECVNVHVTGRDVIGCLGSKTLDDFFEAIVPRGRELGGT